MSKTISLIFACWYEKRLGIYSFGDFWEQWKILELPKKKSFTFRTEHEISITFQLPKLKKKEEEEEEEVTSLHAFYFT